MEAAMAEFDGKAALVTGTSGIARATAARLLRDGARVLACGIDAAANAEMRAALPDVVVRAADVSDAASVQACVAAAVAAFGGLDIVVNAAAIHPFGTVETVTPETWARCMAINVGAIYLTAHFAVPELRRRGGGAIVNLASVQGHACQQNVAAYVASKGAIHALTRAMALDHAADNIRVNSVSPGSVRTPMLATAARAFDGPDADIEAAFRRFGAAHPLGRIAEAEEVAEMIAFLAGPRGGFCTGGDYLVDGGLTAGIGVR
jgi:meso-butanediol dehydrogenase / (S,S)-butanediol dehydrogenase / diacetyl reductase